MFVLGVRLSPPGEISAKDDYVGWRLLRSNTQHFRYYYTKEGDIVGLKSRWRTCDLLNYQQSAALSEDKFKIDLLHFSP